jgi:hypothetical protein
LLYEINNILHVNYVCCGQLCTRKSSELKIDFQQKSRRQKIAAWTLLNTGFIATTIGTIMAAKETVKVVLLPLPGAPLPDEKN